MRRGAGVVVALCVALLVAACGGPAKAAELPEPQRQAWVDAVTGIPGVVAADAARQDSSLGTWDVILVHFGEEVPATSDLLLDVLEAISGAADPQWALDSQSVGFKFEDGSGLAGPLESYVNRGYVWLGLAWLDTGDFTRDEYVPLDVDVHMVGLREDLLGLGGLTDATVKLRAEEDEQFTVACDLEVAPGIDSGDLDLLVRDTLTRLAQYGAAFEGISVEVNLDLEVPISQVASLSVGAEVDAMSSTVAESGGVVPVTLPGTFWIDSSQLDDVAGGSLRPSFAGQG